MDLGPRKLVLYFDINGTIMISDSLTRKTPEIMVHNPYIYTRFLMKSVFKLGEELRKR